MKEWMIQHFFDRKGENQPFRIWPKLSEEEKKIFDFWSFLKK
jgi:hypothetical protein